MAKNMKISNSRTTPPETGGTYISVVSSGGNVYAVDQDGKMINGLISVNAETSINSVTVLTLKVNSYGEKND